ncbi:MAG: lamin tail domain-containing protein [Candidatus Tenebribacter mawsonii]|nr:lamin tail domain-containing protein [Candidatus Tenebribacter mawsonii]
MKKSLLFLFTLLLGSGLFAQECADLFFSEYVEGAGNNKTLEIYNSTNEAVDLGFYTINRYSNGDPDPTNTMSLSGMIQAHDVVVVTNGQTDSIWVGSYWSVPIDPALYEKGDLHGTGDYPTPMYFNGNDAMTLEKITGEIVDIFGKTGFDPGSNGWNDIAPTYTAGNDYWTSWTKDHTLIRKHSVKEGVKGNPAIFMVNVEWDSIAKDYFDSLGYHSCECGTLGISTNNFKHSVVIYPNPSTGKTITISASERIEFVSVVNELGQVVYSQNFETTSKSFQLSGEFLTSGIYVVTARFVDNSFYVDKLIVR